MQISRRYLDQVVAHAVRDAPDECCGVLALRDGVVVGVHELENALDGPKVYGFELAPADLLRVHNEIEDAGDDFGVIYHSHTRSAPYPSQTDFNFARHWPGVEWLIVGTDGDEPEVRNYLIAADGTIDEQPVVVTSE